MKFIVSLLAGIVLGSAATWFYLVAGFSMVNQMQNEASIQSSLKYIEILEQQNADTLKTVLVAGLPCQVKVYEEFLEGYFWEKTDFSQKLIADAKKVTAGKTCPN